MRSWDQMGQQLSPRPPQADPQEAGSVSCEGSSRVQRHHGKALGIILLGAAGLPHSRQWDAALTPRLALSALSCTLTVLGLPILCSAFLTLAHIQAGAPFLPRSL